MQSTNSEYGFIGVVQLDRSGNKYLKTYAVTNIAWNDEFTVLLHNLQNIKQAAVLAEKIVMLSRELYQIERKKIFCSLSIGLVFYPSAGKTFGDLMRRADFALYKAKKNQCQYQFYSDELENYLTTIKT